MMVTFISQCEKNALKKTRRVLDAFANRIGDNAWQTVITQEGLNTVKKMLRQTASKSTAVSCHWIRSRSRSQFLWVVGNKSKFDENGVVPVNYTSNELKKDETKMITETSYANTKKQPLGQHLFAVGYVAYCLVKRLVQNDDNFAIAVFVAGCLHDIGKLDPEFQNWIAKTNKKSIDDQLPEEGQHIDNGKFTFDKHARHNELSLLLYQFFDSSQNLANRGLNGIVEHAIYWHHAKPIRKEEYKTFRDIYRRLDKSLGAYKLGDLLKSVDMILNSANQLALDYQENQTLQIRGFNKEVDESQISSFKKTNLPAYKEYEPEDSIDAYHQSVSENAKKNIARACVITADRLVSALSAERLDDLIGNKSLNTLLVAAPCNESDLSTQIQQCLDGFEQRFPESEHNSAQTDAAKKLIEVEHVAVLKGPAGCGKTKIALEWAALTKAKKIIWVCPRVQVCQGLFLDLTSDKYLPNAQIELCTGEFKYINDKNNITPEGGEFSGDVVLTTIDQILNTIITHTNVTSLVAFMNTHVVFDEYHEYIHMPAFNLLFAELVECKNLQGKSAKALLVSATPNDLFVKELLQIDRDDVIDIDSFNQSRYRIRFEPFDEAKADETNPLFQSQPKNSIVISNTATTAQHSFIVNQAKENAALLHGKFTKLDKLSLFDKIFNAFKQDGNRKYDLLRSGPIVQASLNITCDHMVTEFTLAENWLQRLGRLDRFGEREEVNQYITAVPQTLAEGRGTGACARFLSALHCLQSAKAWHQFLQDKLTDQPIAINQIYKLYAEFYQSEVGKKAVEQDLIGALKKSVQVIANKVHDPICFPKKKSREAKKKLKKSSLRGDSRYVQMAICKVNKDGSIEFVNQYVCDSQKHIYTMPVTDIEGFIHNKDDKNLLNFMHQKHHKFESAKKQKRVTADSIYVIKGKAIEPEFPIFVSYIEEDLALCNDKPHPHAIYYAVGEKQSIGALSINKLNNTINKEE